MKISIIGNCQAINMTAAMQIMAPSADISAAVVDGTGRVSSSLVDSDIICLQTSHSDILDTDDERLDHRYSERIKLWPNIYYTAYHPDLYFVYKKDGRAYQSAMGDYSSVMVVYAWMRGLSPRDAENLFCESVYEHLGYFSHGAISEATIRVEGEKCGLDLLKLLGSWKSRGCFMHSPSHPKLFAASDIGRSLLEACGVAVAVDEPERFLQDWVLNWASWPVYPDIARRLGIQGGYEFKLPKNLCPPDRPVEVINLQEFIARSYARYDSYPREDIRLLDHMEQAFAEFPVPAARPKRRQTPYSNLPPYQFWRSAFVPSADGDFDPVVAPRFKIGPKEFIASCGSCFAQHIARALVQQGYNYLKTEGPSAAARDATARPESLFSAEFGNIYTARQLLQLFDRAYGRLTPVDAAWRRADGRCIDPFRPQVRPEGFDTPEEVAPARSLHLAAVRTMFEASDILIFTVGLTETWRAKVDGAVFPIAPGVASEGLPESDYEFVNFSAGEVAADLREFCSRVRQVNPNLRLILTVSPVPLVATFENRNAVVSTTYSKSVLRAAVDEIWRAFEFVEYFPSYEIITHWYNGGRYFEEDLRSVTPEGVEHAMRVFAAHYLDRPQRAAAVTIPPAVATARLEGLKEQIARGMKFACDEELLDPGPS